MQRRRVVFGGLLVLAGVCAVSAQNPTDASAQNEINKLFQASHKPFTGVQIDRTNPNVPVVTGSTTPQTAETLYTKTQVDELVQAAITDLDADTQTKFDQLYTPALLPLPEVDPRRRMYTQNEVEAIRDELQHEIDINRAAIAENLRMIQLEQMSVDIAWLVICGALVFFMQAGFAMLEAGIVHPKNVSNILFKNMIDASIAALCFWLLGYGFAYGDDVGGFIGNSAFANDAIYNGAGGPYAGADGGYTTDGWEGWFFQWAFTGACATIVAGSVCERTKLEAYFIYSFVLTTFIYPIVVHWGWGAGFLSAWGAYPDSDGVPRPLFKQNVESNGMIDFAGSGVVHMVGGFSGLMGAIVVGPRKDRFEPWYKVYEGNHHLQALGVFILWFGWYGFNCGSTLAISGGVANIAGKVAFTTTISAATGCITATFLARVVEGKYDITIGLNGILAGLVSITANTSVVDPWHALLIGMAGAVVFYGGHFLLIAIKVDDPCDACVVHGFCGCWGLWATGIFCTDANIAYAGYPNGGLNDACKRGEQFGVQVVGSLAIIAWTCVTAGLLFLVINLTIGMRVSSEVEEMGLDVSEHGLSKPTMVDVGGGYPPVEKAMPMPMQEPTPMPQPQMVYQAPPRPPPVAYPDQGPGIYRDPSAAPPVQQPPGIPAYYNNAPPGYDGTGGPAPGMYAPVAANGLYASQPGVYSTQPAPAMYGSQPQFLQS